MTFTALPDTEAMVLDALRFYLAAENADFGISPPADWNKLLPFVVVTRVGGKTPHPRVDHSILSVSVFAAARKRASDVSRKAQAALYQAAKDGFATSEGVISWFDTVKGPVPIRDGLSGKHADSFMFDATYHLWARSHYTTSDPFPTPTVYTPSTGGSFYEFVQLTPASVWLITHDLGYKPNVILQDSNGDEIDGSVTWPTTNTVQVAFGAATAGAAHLS